MYSLYFHIPFCVKKCNYCSFYIIPTENKDFSIMKDKYLESMKNELMNIKPKLKNNKIYSIYFGWWTPSELWLERVVDLLNFIKREFDLNNCQEISFELNPNPLNQTLEFINTLPNIVDNFRFSIWIQSLENDILEKSWRNYNFQFIEKLMKNIKENKKFHLNLDFISFGIEKDFNIFNNFLNKNKDKIDSLSIYTLELFSGSIWGSTYQTNEDKILDNFEKYINIVKKYNYKRYEISNFAKKWRESKHNQVYWEMKEYIWIWSSASGFHTLHNWNKVRYTNSYWIQNYIKWKFEYKEYKKLTKQEFLEEQIFLGLRTDKWIKLTDNIKKILNLKKINEFREHWYLTEKNNYLYFTDKWFNLYNYIITEILKLKTK